MFFKADQTNVADARDAVKKQLLRSLIQQVVEELNDTSAEGIGLDVLSILAEDGMQDVIHDLKTSMADSLRNEIVTSVVSDSISGMTTDTEEVKNLLKDQLSKADLSVVRDSVRELNASMIDDLCNEMIATVVTESLSEVTPESSNVQELVSVQLAQADVSAIHNAIRGEVEAQLTQQVLPAAVEEETRALENLDLSQYGDKVKDAVACMNADDMIGRLRTMVADSLEERIKIELDEEVRSTNDSLDRIQDEFVAERMDQFLLSADWKVALEKAEADITARVVSAVEETMANDAAFGQRIEEEIEVLVKENDALKARLEANATERVVTILSDQIVADLDENEKLKSDLVAAVTSDEEAMTALVEHVSERVHEHLGTETVTRLHNAEKAADAAFLHVDTEHRHITDAVDSLEKQLVKEISGRAVARLADSQTVQTKAMAWIPEDHSIVTSAVEQILQHVSSEVRKRAIKEASDTETVVGNVLPSFTAETEEVRAAVRETRNKLVERVVNLTLHEMEDPKQVAAEANKRVANEHEHLLEAVASAMGMLTDRVADQAIDRLAASDEVAPEAASRVPVDNEVFQRAIKATMSLLIDDIVIEVGSRMRSAEKVSSDARKRMAETPAEVRQAAGVLENMLLQQVAETTKERLYDVQHASEKASTFLRATREIDAIEEAMRVKLFKGMAEHVVASIEDPEKSGAEAFWHIDQQHDHILDAIAELRNQLLFNIANETMTSISDSEAAAEESRALIPATSRQMTEAASKLHDALIAEVAREAMNLMRDTEQVVERAGAKLEDHQEALDGMRRIVERHLMENLLASALTDIGSNVAGMDESAERVFFRSAVRDIQNGRGKAAAPEVPDSAARMEEAETVSPIREEEPAHLDAEAAPQSIAGDTEIQTEQAEQAEQTEQTEQTEQAEQTEEKSVNSGEDAWSSLDELSGHQSAKPSKRSWRVNEFRPADREAMPGAVSGSTRTRMPSFPKKEAKRSALYLFGVVRTEDARPEEFEGIEGITEGSFVRLLSCGTLTALVSSTPDARVQPDTIKESMSDSDWLKAHVRRHADVLAEAQTIQTVIPLRFGCVMPNPSEIKKFVDAREESLMDALTRLRNRSEFSVRVRFDDGQEGSDDLKGVPSGVADFLRQAAADVEHAPSPDGIADRIHSHLARFAGEAMRDAVDGTEMILNATYLITMASEDDFRMEVRKLSSEFHALGIRIEVSGPWPPYHFVNIDFGGGQEEEVA